MADNSRGSYRVWPGWRFFHAPFLQAIDGLELADLRAAWRRCRGGVSGSCHRADVEEFLETPELELVVVTTPPSTHYELARRASRPASMW